LADEEAADLNLRYYLTYGLSIRGLIKNHHVGLVISDCISLKAQVALTVYAFTDPMDFDRQCDGSLPLEEMIQFNPATRRLFEDLDRTKVRVWALTNAYRTVRTSSLDIISLFEMFPPSMPSVSFVFWV
jgi:pyrimidine and pyridine-specific 5'-nucleotidase